MESVQGMGTSFTFSMVGSEILSSNKGQTFKRKQKKQQNEQLQAIEEEALSVQLVEEQNESIESADSSKGVRLPNINSSTTNNIQAEQIKGGEQPS